MWFFAILGHFANLGDFVNLGAFGNLGDFAKLGDKVSPPAVGNEGGRGHLRSHHGDQEEPEASLDILHELLSIGNETLQMPGSKKKLKL